GLDDLLFVGGENGLSVGWIDASDMVPGDVVLSHAQPGGLSDFGDADTVPVTAETADLDGNGRLDVMVGFLLANDPEHDAVSIFTGRPDRGFDNPIIANNGGLVLLSKGLADFELSDLNA